VLKATDAEEPIHDDSDADLAVSNTAGFIHYARDFGAAGQRAAGVLPVRAGVHAGKGGLTVRQLGSGIPAKRTNGPEHARAV
jgi:hypothetical protein